MRKEGIRYFKTYDKKVQMYRCKTCRHLFHFENFENLEKKPHQFICSVCGKATERIGRNVKRCLDCCQLKKSKKKKICVNCGEEFYPSHYGKICCSDECLLEHRRKYHREYEKKYKETHPAYREYLKNYRQENKEIINQKRKENWDKYKARHTETHRKYKRKWNRTKKGKENKKRERLRHRNKTKGRKWIPILPNIFPEEIPVDYHHIDRNWFVVPLPENIHRMSNGIADKHLKENNEWVEFYYDFDVAEFLGNNLMGVEK